VARSFFERFDPFLTAAEADAMVRLFETFPGGYGMYVQESPGEGIGRGFLQRHDAAMHFFETGGRSGKAVSLETFAARANTLRETYAYDRPVVAGIEPLLANERFHDAARRLFGKPIVVPNIVYANVVLPGQELSVHTDVPEFRGANRKHEPEWLLVVMHLSGLFERWRMPIATGVSWYGNCAGGGFYFYPDGIEGPELQLEPKHNTAVLLDTDSVFHGVDLVGEPDVELPDLQPGIRLRHAGGSRWHVERDGRELARYDWDDVRLSISWKAYCFADEAERRMVEEHSDDLDRGRILGMLVEDLRRRGRIRGEVPPERELGEMLMREYVRFPLQPHARPAARTVGAQARAS
jgi:hypothetical protein